MKSERQGLNVIKVIIVFVLIVILMSLILLPMEKAKRRSRTDCLNSFRIVAMAIMSESASQQRLTPQSTYRTEKNW